MNLADITIPKEEAALIKLKVEAQELVRCLETRIRELQDEIDGRKEEGAAK